jgi:acyl-coenzyme A synthetase/AMP-(fatty) acid ligase
MTEFWVDSKRSVDLGYDELVDELTERTERRPIVYDDDPSEVFIETLLAMLDGSDLVLLDAEFSDKTLRYLGYDEAAISETRPTPDVQISDRDDLVREIEAVPDQWTLSLYTSGTTGTPSRVDQTFDTLTRSVRTGERFNDHVWAFAYNPTHIAGIQVFFQAISNGNSMINVFEQSTRQIGELLDRYEVTHISATPTFYRLRLQELSGTYESVVRLTSGGERFEPSVREALEESFPNAEFRNVYATTETGSLLESAGETFRIPDSLRDRVKISEENELVVHWSLLGDVSEQLDGSWFHTGDVVEFVDDEHFRFVGRESDFVNVGGYRVNPHEVEAHINELQAVEAAVVTARESSVTGNVLTAEVQPADDVDADVVEERVKDAVDSLERWKQPRIIDVVDEISQSRTGKRVRGESSQ